MVLTMGELARALDAQCWGDATIRVTGAAEPAAVEPAGPEGGVLAMAMAPKYAERLRPGSIAILAEGMDPEAYGLKAAIFAPRPRLVMAGLTRAFDPGPDIAPGSQAEDCSGSVDKDCDGKLPAADPDCFCNDGKLSGDESDVDCGGSCSACALGKLCNSNADCAAYGAAAGNCTLTSPNPCFLDPISATGVQDPNLPVAVAAFCIPATGNSGINTVAGLPGPGRVTNAAQAESYCASNPAVAYTPGVGGCPPP